MTPPSPKQRLQQLLDDPGILIVPGCFDALSARLGNIKLMRLGSVKKGGAGCLCPESTLLKALVTHVVLGRDEVVIMDMEAGIEHLDCVQPRERYPRCLWPVTTVRGVGKPIVVSRSGSVNL